MFRSGWYGSGCFGGMPVSYGCVGGIPVSGGCYGGCYGGRPVGYGCAGSIPVSGGCYGGVSVGYGCFGSRSVGYGCFGSRSLTYSGPVEQGRTIVTQDALEVEGSAIEVYRESQETVVRPADSRLPPPTAAPPRQIKEPAPVRAAPPARPGDQSVAEPIGAPEEAAPEPSPATLVISLPAEAKLTINRTPTRSTSATRTFVTPPLQPGKDCRYTLYAEAVRDGRIVTVTRQVAVRAGETKKITLTFSSAGDVSRN
jgi:uncharacterized protein (TIGR03000 family)